VNKYVIKPDEGKKIFREKFTGRKNVFCFDRAFDPNPKMKEASL